MYRDNLFRELIIDNFAGGGGASVGIELALGAPVDIAVNHDENAIAMHTVNHPYTEHFREDVFAIDPEKVTGGRTIHCRACGYSEIVWHDDEKCFYYECRRPLLTRPPMSWCYVEEFE